MNKTYLLFKHEFIQAIKKTGYIILTLFIPVFALLSIGVSKLIDVLIEPPVIEVTIIGFVDEAGFISDHNTQGLIEFIPYSSRVEASQALIEDDISEYIVIPPDYFSAKAIERYTKKNEVDTPMETYYSIDSFLTWNLIKDSVPHETIASILSPLDLEVIKVNDVGEIAGEQGNMGNIIIPGIFALLLSLSFQFGSSTLISSLGEEKESRLIEVLFSSISVRQLMIGKILALGAAGLLQVLIWLLSAPLILNLASSSIGGFLTEIHIPPNFIVLGIVYFVLGYLLFSILSVTIGAISANATEAYNLATIYILMGYVPLWTFAAFINFPDSPVWIVLTIFPVTAPIQTMVRLGIAEIPAWQIATSIAVMLLSIMISLFLSEKLFRTFLLMYGKRPRLSEIIRSLRQA